MAIFAVEINKKLNPLKMTIMKTYKAIILVVMMTIATSASAMSYSEAREEALFLADKMAYELNLTDEQYEAAYEINLDYLLHVDSYADAYGAYWRIRNNSLAAILADWQYSLYEAAAYFFRPLTWIDNVLNLRIYTRYTNPRKFYRSRPVVYVTYRGGHNLNYYKSRSWKQPSRKINRQQPSLPQRSRSVQAKRNWNNQTVRTRTNNQNRSWTAPTNNRNQKVQSNNSWRSQNRQLQSKSNQVRVESRSKSNGFSIGNSQSSAKNRTMLAQNNKRSTRSSRR